MPVARLLVAPDQKHAGTKEHHEEAGNSRRAVHTHTRKPRGVPIAMAMRCGDLIFVSNDSALRSAKRARSNASVDRQSRCASTRWKACLEAGGSSLDKVVKCNVYCNDPTHFATSQHGVRTLFCVRSAGPQFVFRVGLARSVRRRGRLHRNGLTLS